MRANDIIDTKRYVNPENGLIELNYYDVMNLRWFLDKYTEEYHELKRMLRKIMDIIDYEPVVSSEEVSLVNHVLMEMHNLTHSLPLNVSVDLEECDPRLDKIVNIYKEILLNMEEEIKRAEDTLSEKKKELDLFKAKIKAIN